MGPIGPNEFKFGALALGAPFLVFLASFAILKSYGVPGQAQIGANYPMVLCGMTIGGLWQDCLAKYSQQIQGLASENEVASVLYGIALHNVISEPGIFLASMWSGIRRFLIDVPTFPIVGYIWPVAPQYFSIWPLYILTIVGWLWAARKVTRGEIYFWLLLFAGIILSIPFIYFEDARRVDFFATLPLALAFLAAELVTPLSAHVAVAAPLKCRPYVIALAATTILTLLSPTLKRRFQNHAFSEFLSLSRLLTTNALFRRRAI